MKIRENRTWILVGAGLVILEAFLFWKYGYHWIKTLRYQVLTAFLVALGVIDYREQLVPNRLLLILSGIRGILLIIEVILFREIWADLLISAFAGMGMGFLVFLIAKLIARNGIGWGDIKLTAVMGSYLGSSLILFDILVCLILCAVYSLVQLIGKKKTLHDSLPMVPFFSVGTILLLIIGF